MLGREAARQGAKRDAGHPHVVYDTKPGICGPGGAIAFGERCRQLPRQVLTSQVCLCNAAAPVTLKPTQPTPCARPPPVRLAGDALTTNPSMESAPASGTPGLGVMSSLSPECAELKASYDACFNAW